MGCIGSQYIDIYTKNERISNWKPEFEALGFSEREIGRLFRIFRKIDADDSGELELAELLVHLDLDRTPFTIRVFSIFDEDGSGQVDFREFVLSLWNYCTLSRATLVMFAFDLYDLDTSGEIGCDEVGVMLHDVYGKSSHTNHHARAISEELGELSVKNEPFDVDAFRMFCKTHGALLFPAFHMQESIQKKVLGVEFWHYCSEKRVEVSKGVFITIGDFLELHVNKQLYSDYVIGNTKIVKKPVMANKTLAVIQSTGTKAQRSSKPHSPGDVMSGKKWATTKPGALPQGVSSSSLGTAGSMSRGPSASSSAGSGSPALRLTDIEQDEGGGAAHLRLHSHHDPPKGRTTILHPGSGSGGGGGGIKKKPTGAKR